MSLKYQIAQKTKYGKSFYATNQTVGKTITDMDNFPYQRFYRGEYQSNQPIIFDREAGYRHVSNSCYSTVPSYSVEYPNYCFESACSTIYPCVPAQQIAETRTWVYRSV